MSEFNCECGRTYHPRQSWIHKPACRYLAGIEGRPELPVNHVKPEQRGYYRGPSVTATAQSVTQTVTLDAPGESSVTESVTVVINSNAERQRRWREKQKSR